MCILLGTFEICPKSPQTLGYNNSWEQGDYPINRLFVVFLNFFFRIFHEELLKEKIQKNSIKKACIGSFISPLDGEQIKHIYPTNSNCLKTLGIRVDSIDLFPQTHIWNYKFFISQTILVKSQFFRVFTFQKVYFVNSIDPNDWF